MLKKYKILMSLIALVLLGIMFVISIWLYGIYKNKQETLVSEVERSLFNTVQSYYRAEEQMKPAGVRPFDRDGPAFLDEIKKTYPEVDQKKLKQIWDSLRNQRTRHFERRFKERGSSAFFMLPNIEVEEDDLAAIQSGLEKSLKSKGTTVHAKVNLLSASDSVANDLRRRYEVTPTGDINTRSILINPSKNVLLFSTIKNPVFFLLGRMSLQIMTSVALVLALIAAFSYLLLTISKQNRMAILRKSFVNNMTHELKTPVATVMAAIEAVQRYGARDDKTKMTKYLDISHRELEHLSTLIERVLQLDIDGVSGLPLDKVSFDINQLMQECIEIAKLGCDRPAVIEFFTNNTYLHYTGDRSHIKSVFSNLLDNAIKYANEKIHIVVHIDGYENQTVITVQDHGQGIEEKYLDHIFDMFFRVPAGNLHPVKGFGLGLSYVKLIVERHGGHIKVQSKSGEGTTFKIILPTL